MSKIFAHRRNFLYQRANPNAQTSGGLLGATPNAQNGDGGNPSTPAVDTPATNAKTSIPIINPLTPAQSTESSTTPAAVTTPAQSTPASSSSASSSSSPTQAASSASASSSPTAHATSSSTPPSNATPSTLAYSAATLATQAAAHTSFVPMSTLSPTTSSSAGSGSSGGTNTGAIVGGIAGTLAGIAVLGFLLMWCLRRQRNKDFDDFDAQAFKRQSAVLVDDPVEPSRSYNARPPTMIESHNASPALAAQTGYGSQNFYGNYGGYGQQQPYTPEMIQSNGSSTPQAYGAQPVGYAGYSDPQPSAVGQPNAGHTVYDTQQQLARQPSNATYLTRQPNAAIGYAAPAVPPALRDPSAQYTKLSRSSVTPYQAAQYADISRQLGTADPNAQLPREAVDMPDGPLPSPFDDPPAHYRPTTVYEEGDAYSGI